MMMKQQLYIIILIFGFSISVYAQNNKPNFEKKLIQHFQEESFDDVVVTRDSLYTSIFDENKFYVSLSDNPINFDITRKIIKNPYFSTKYKNAEDYRERIKNFPKSYSVIYKNHLISLFENGKFTCFKLDNFKRDIKFENQLNTKKFDYHWIIGNQLGALSGNKIYLWNGKKWIKSKEGFPLDNQPKLFEDNEFIVYRDCHGEWGGTVYFYEKSTAKTYFTESTCSNSIIKTDKGYQVLAHLGHGFGSAQIKVIADPRKLTLANPKEINKRFNGNALGYKDESNAFEITLDFYGVQIFSSFLYKERKLYIVSLPNLTFIAEINGNNIEIVHPLFFNELYTHNPITTQYGNYILINLDFYGIGLNREISVLIIKGNQITKIDWNENHSR